MPGTKRPRLPGAVFHVTARTQGGDGWFCASILSEAVEILHTCMERSDASLMALGLMPNHLHLILRQGDLPLGYTMQPLLRRYAALLARTHSLRGHVFERRYFAKHCATLEHARTAIVYTHLNPFRAGLCPTPGDYPWTSHRWYAAHPAGEAPADPLDGCPPTLARLLGLGLFAPHAGASLDACRAAYDRYLRWRVDCDDHARCEVGQPAAAPPLQPQLDGLDHWTRYFVGEPTDAPAIGPQRALRPPREELKDIAISVLLERKLAGDLDWLRTPNGPAARRDARTAFARRARRAGYSGAAIARFLGVSAAAVSRMPHRRDSGHTG
jgi:putative transposase